MLWQLDIIFNLHNLCLQGYTTDHHSIIIHPLIHRLDIYLTPLGIFPFMIKHKKVHENMVIYLIFLLFHPLAQFFLDKTSTTTFSFPLTCCMSKEYSWSNSTQGHYLQLKVCSMVKNLSWHGQSQFLNVYQKVMSPNLQDMDNS
jgi:hypothetical protein